MSIVELGLLLVTFVALGIAWRASKRAETLERKVERLQSSIFETRGDLRDTREELETRLSSLDLALKKSTGQLRFDPSIHLKDLFEIEPRAQGLLAAFHIGGCAHCAVDDGETLAEAVQQNGRNLDQVLAALNNLPPDGQSAEIRVPNVHFEF